MVDPLVAAGAGGAAAAALIHAAIALMASLRRSRVVRFVCCCGLCALERDPLEGGEIADDARAALLYPRPAGAEPAASAAEPAASAAEPSLAEPSRGSAL